MNRFPQTAFVFLGWLAGYIILIHFVPRAIPTESATAIVSAAAAQGYNAPVAYWVALIWSVIIIAVSAVWARKSQAAAPDPVAPPARGRLIPLELLIVFGIFVLAYFPAFLARYGPFNEDEGFIMVLFRMACGQVPFRDFEFLYGPLMLYPMWGWTKIFGVSMESYFGFIALQEGLQFALLMAVLQLTVKDRWWRYCIFLLLLPFLVNTLLGPNWSALRRLVPVFALLLVAYRPFDMRTNLAVAAITGLHLAYSHEYAAATLLGIGTIYGMLLFGPHRREALRSGLVIAIGAVLIWVLSISFMLGENWRFYLETARQVTGVMSQGHAAFEFYWTVNSVAQIALLTLVCMLVGGVIVRVRGEMQPGDLYLAGGLVYALVILKSGLARADHWHFSAPFLVLYFAFLLNLPTLAARMSAATRRGAVVLIGITSFTYLIGIYPTGHHYMKVYLRGAQDVLTAVPTADIDPGNFRAPSVQFERTTADPDIVALGGFLATPAQAHKPVLFHGKTWFLSTHAGICRQDYKHDDIMYSEIERPERDFLVQNPDALVVMFRSDYERIYGFTDPDSSVRDWPWRRVEKLARWTTTVHRQQRVIEGKLLNQARDNVTGRYIRDHYQVLSEFGVYMVLAPVVSENSASYGN